MEAEEMTNPVVRAVMSAVRDADRRAFFQAFAPSAKLTDDGDLQPLVEWADREISRAHGRFDVEPESRDGFELAGAFHSDPWDLKTVWRFDIIDGRVRRLDVAAV